MISLVDKRPVANRLPSVSLVVLSATLVVVCCWATVAQTQSVDNQTSELQQRVETLGYQLNLVGKFDRRQSQKRYQQLAVALDRWNLSARSNADAEQMHAWLDGAIEASLPGSKQSMPTLPRFTQLAVQPTPEKSSPEAIKPGVITESAPVATPEVPAATAIKESPEPPAPVVAAAPPVIEQAWKRHPGAKPVELDNPFTDDQPLASNPTRTPRVAMRPAGVGVTESTEVSINVAELSARAMGYSHGLRGVEARLMSAPKMDADTLLSVAKELAQLNEQRQFVELYLGALEPDEHQRAPELATLNQAKSLATTRLESLQQDSTSDATTLERIEGLLNQLP